MQPSPFYLRSYAVPKLGARLVETAQFTRDIDGRAHFWFGRSKHPGTGHASSGVPFDFVDRDDAFK